MTATAFTERAIVTGGGSGLGRAIAIELARRGASVIVVGRRLAALQQTAASAGGGEIIPIAGDVTDVATLTKCWDEIERRGGGGGRALDTLVCCAGIKLKGDATISYADVARTMEVNFLSVVRWIERLLPLVERSVRGRIVTISSMGGGYGLPHSDGYNPSKAALNNFTECLRADLLTRESSVRVVNVRPGFIATEMVSQQGFTPFRVSVDHAARLVVAAADAGKADVAFPFPMSIAAGVLSVLPKNMLAWVGARLVSRPRHDA
jgi:NAD(P)-dependent dehydrogenase (short-subunit alcohol dehydrogenase family)